MRRFAIGVVVVGAGLLASNSAWASFHANKITEVFPGTSAAPNAQYIEVQAYFAGQNFVNNQPVQIFDAAGTMVAMAKFSGTPADGSSHATFLIATTEAATLFGVTPDLTITAGIALAGGKVCFATGIDCVAWGGYSGDTSSVGAPAFQALGLVRGRALIRRLDQAGDPTLVDEDDDTDDSANDFVFGAPSPRNNAGQTGTAPTSTCGDSNTEGLEGCDDGNTADNDGCTAGCFTEVCGDAVVQTSEECDDGNTDDSDGCTMACATATPMPDGGPTGDAGTGGTDDGGGCCQSGPAGAAPGIGLGVLALVLRRRRRPTAS
jgi:cysteine-rich repeat protein